MINLKFIINSNFEQNKMAARLTNIAEQDGKENEAVGSPDENDAQIHSEKHTRVKKLFY